MKFEAVRIYLAKWRFWLVVWSKNFATVATWPNQKNNNSNLHFQQLCTCAAHFFVHFFDLGFHDDNVKLPSSFYVGKCRMCSAVFCHVPVHFFPTLSLIFTLLAAFSHFLTANFYVFPPTKFVSCSLSNALALLSTSLKTLKFNRTWLCWFFSLLSPDGLSLSKKLGWI